MLDTSRAETETRLAGLEALACGIPVAAYPVTGPVDVVTQGVTGFCNEDLESAAVACLELDGKKCRAYAEKFSWKASAEEFVRNLQPYPEPEKTRFWKRLRRLARLRRKPAA